MLWGCLYMLIFEMNRVRLIVSSSSHAQYLKSLRFHTIFKWLIIGLHSIKTILLSIINYIVYQHNNNSFKQEVTLSMKIELWCKIIVELFMYPLFLYCYIYFVKRHKEESPDDITLQKFLIIMWIYTLFVLNVLYNIYSVVFRLTRTSSIYD